MTILWLLIATCVNVVRTTVNWHTILCWRFILMTVNITTLPLLALAALHRERMMETLLQEIQAELQNATMENKRLDRQLQTSIREHHLMESMLSELEGDLDKAIDKIEFLEEKVHQLRTENLKLREVKSKTLWDPATKINPKEDEITCTHYNETPRQFSKSSTVAEGQPGGTQRNPTGLVDPHTPLVFSSDIDNDDAALLQRRELALSQSLFSALLSLLVGVITWEAKEPCLPLVMALFTVVGLSLRSVVQFFSTINNRPASSGIALLSLNWFILGALTYPTLPRVAWMVFGSHNV